MDKDIYWHELNAYKTEIIKLQEEIKTPLANRKEIVNRTHFSLGISNRTNLMVIGLCSLVEVFLFELAAREEAKTTFKIEDLKGNGLERLQTYLTRTGKVDFGKISQWSDFKHFYLLRNALIHSYGGLVETTFIERVEKAVVQLKIESALFGNRRIRLTPEILLDFQKLIENLIAELKLIA
jgi:hypothetical protein